MLEGESLDDINTIEELKEELFIVYNNIDYYGLKKENYNDEIRLIQDKIKLLENVEKVKNF